MENKVPILEKQKKRIVFLDAMRGIAALMVVYFHYSTNFFKHYPGFLPKSDWLFDFKFGGAGVELFFIISGFVILMTLEKSKKLKDFIISRLSRLYPPYWFAIILTSAVVAIFPITHGPVLTLSQKLANLLMFHTWIGIPNVDGVYWTLGLELVFYTIMAILYVLKVFQNTTGKVFWIFNGLFIIQLTLKFYPDLTNLLPFSFLKVLLDHFTLRGYGSLFMAGMLFYEGYKDSFKPLLLIQLAVCLLQYEVINYNLVPEHCVIAPLFFLLFYVSCIGKAGFIENKFLIFIGSISYSLYLIHAYVGYGIMRFLYTEGYNTGLTQVAMLVTIVFLSWVMNKLVEVPLSKKLKDVLVKVFK